MLRSVGCRDGWLQSVQPAPKRSIARCTRTPTLASPWPPCYRLITSTGCPLMASSSLGRPRSNRRLPIHVNRFGGGRGGAPHSRVPPTRQLDRTSHRPLFDGYRHRKLKPICREHRRVRRSPRATSRPDARTCRGQRIPLRLWTSHRPRRRRRCTACPSIPAGKRSRQTSASEWPPREFIAIHVQFSSLPLPPFSYLLFPPIPFGALSGLWPTTHRARLLLTLTRLAPRRQLQ